MLNRLRDWLNSANIDLWLSLLGLLATLYAVGWFLAYYHQVMPSGIKY